MNKIESKVTLLWDVDDCASITADQRDRVHRKLASRINREGTLRVVSSKHRTQAANRRASLERFLELLAGALRLRRVRRKTRPTKSSVERRLTGKRHRGETKQSRSQRFRADDD